MVIILLHFDLELNALGLVVSEVEHASIPYCFELRFSFSLPIRTITINATRSTMMNFSSITQSSVHVVPLPELIRLVAELR